MKKNVVFNELFSSSDFRQELQLEVYSRDKEDHTVQVFSSI